MPSVTIDAYQTLYVERADLDYSWQEWGTSRYGFRSHARKPGDGAQWDRTRAAQYAVFGLRLSNWSPSTRVIWCHGAEGPHETGGAFVFQPPVGRVTLSDARLLLPGAAPVRVRVYGVAMDNFTTQYFGSDGYPVTYRAEFHERTWSPVRRYRAESVETELPHTEAEVLFPAGVLPPSIASVVQEIISRPGWKAGNRLCLMVGPDFDPLPQPLAPREGPVLEGGLSATGGDLPWTPPVVPVTGGIATFWAANPPQLSLTY